METAEKKQLKELTDEELKEVTGGKYLLWNNVLILPWHGPEDEMFLW